jgi:hypothetical protein
VRFILVDACAESGSEADNEFFVLHSGSGFAVNDLGFSTPTGTVVVTHTNHEDFITVNPCSSCITGCNVIFITNGDQVPAGKHVLVFTSANVSFLSYDVTGLCTDGDIYLLVTDATPGSGQFANYSSAVCSGCTQVSGNQNRTTTVTLSGGCHTEATYNRCLLRNLAGNCGAQDGGAVVFQNGNTFYNNNGCASPALPVEFGDFVAEKEEGGVRLAWTTFRELNNDYFSVQRSVDGFSFEDIGRVAGAGFSEDIRMYEYEDLQPPDGITFYRIQQTDFDGKTGFSNVRAVRFDAEERVKEVRICRDKIRIRGGEEPLNVSMYTSGGQLITSLPDQKGDIEVRLDSLHHGVYFLTVHNRFFLETFRFVR